MDCGDKAGSINLPMIDLSSVIILSRVHDTVVLTGLSYQPGPRVPWNWKCSAQRILNILAHTALIAGLHTYYNLAACFIRV